MQRLFSNFANGWPGIGLLIQRLLIGTALLRYSVAHLAHTNHLTILVPSILGGAAGILLVLGLWTPGACVLAALTEIWGTCWHLVDVRIAIILATIATALVMIGPGAWSIDARLFGRKHLEIPNR
jgi:putative oxidoreductase